MDGNSYTTVKTDYQLDVTGSINLKSNASITIEAADGIILKVGGSFISISASSITEQSGKLLLNCGAPAPEAPAQAERLLPDPPKGANSGAAPDGGEKVNIKNEAIQPASVSSSGASGGTPSSGASTPPLTRTQNMKNLSDETVRLINQSPILTKQLKDHQDVSISYGPKGGGTYYDSYSKAIVIDGNETDPAISTHRIAHEFGHITGPKENNSSRSEYVQGYLDSEGAATLNNYAVREEILNSGGADIGIGGRASNKPAYDAIYNDYKKGTVSQDEARRQIGNVFGTSETPSTNPSINYRQYYDDFAKKFFP